eukprot:TRINITY_DN4381_c2_g1_i2.p1 TRINITY_DN4381_c2_g1~~TRINITY_DN4381_c2_g1_i2.p1  ORF type:complete len:121 (+),score=26.18 TRINITY_DN4381_c2_g1_i2:164-526(+)
MFLKRAKGSVGLEEAEGVSLSSHFKLKLPLQRQLRERTVPPIFNSAERKYPHNTTKQSVQLWLKYSAEEEKEKANMKESSTSPKPRTTPTSSFSSPIPHRPNSTHTLQNPIQTQHTERDG